MLRVREIFESIDGEINYFHQGSITTFLRTSGCNLKCNYCDSTAAQTHSSMDRMLHTPALIKRFYIAHLKNLTTGKVTITGGEPLLQEEGVNCLIEYLIEDKIKVTIETNGSIKHLRHYFHPLVGYIADYKLPSSGMERRMNINFLCELTPQDILKFVVGDYFDYKRARKLIKEEFIGTRAVVALQPVYNRLDPKLLFEWVRRDNLPNIVLSIQLHKLLKMQ